MFTSDLCSVDTYVPCLWAFAPNKSFREIVGGRKRWNEEAAAEER
jgi:hypothetical protein